MPKIAAFLPLLFISAFQQYTDSVEGFSKCNLWLFFFLWDNVNPLVVEKNNTLKKTFPRKQTGFSKHLSVERQKQFFWAKISLRFDTVNMCKLSYTVHLLRYKWTFILFTASREMLQLYFFHNINNFFSSVCLFEYQESAQCTFILKIHDTFCCFIDCVPDFLLLRSMKLMQHRSKTEFCKTVKCTVVSLVQTQLLRKL